MNCPLGKCLIATNCQNLAICNSIASLYASRGVSDQKLLNKQRKEDVKQEFVGTYAGYNATNSCHLVEVNGYLYSVENFSNSYINAGARIPVTIYQDRAFITAMPSS